MEDLLDFAGERPLFNLNEAQRATGHDRNYLRKKLSVLTDREDLYRVERGMYSSVDDPFVYGSFVERPSYISLWSALSFYNLTTQEPTKVQVICSKSRSDLEKVSFYSSKNVFGYSKEVYRGFEVFVADKEMLFLDVLRKGKVPLDELDELVEDLDLSKVIEYAERLESKAVSRRAGFLVEKLRGETLKGLKVKDSNYPVLDLTKSSNGVKDKEWRIEVNNDAF